MRQQKKVFRHKGKEFPATFMLPDSLQEALKILDEKEVFECFETGFVQKQRRLALGLKSREKKWLKVKLTELPDDLVRLLKDQGIV